MNLPSSRDSNGGKPDDGRWIRSYDPAAAGAPRLLCLPHAGGSASFYLPVSRALSPAIDVLAVQYPGRQDRRSEPCVDDIHRLARQVFHVFRPWAGRPVAIFGHSMGACLGFELARLAEQQAGVVVSYLFVSGRRAPSRHRHETVHLRDDEGMLADVRRLSGTDARVFGDDELLRAALPAIRSDYKAAETYVYQAGPRLSCPIMAFTGTEDPKTTTEEAQAWAEHTTGGFELSVYPGGHFFLAQHQAEILRTISERMAVAPAGRAS
jgi:surfactin synthase thioesterase subunit